MIARVIGSLLVVLNANLSFGQVAPAPAESWQTTFFDSPATALPILTRAAIQHSAQLKSIEVEKLINKLDVKIAKKNILAAVAVGSTYSYGNLASVTLADPNRPNQFNTFSSSRYSSGVSVALPLDRVVSRSTLIKKEELNYQHSELLRQDREDIIRQQLISLYGNVLLAKKILTLRQEGYLSMQTSFRLAEKQFRQGQLALPEFSQANVQFTEMAITQESARSEYDAAFLLLEEVVGVKIPILMKTQ